VAAPPQQPSCIRSFVRHSELHGSALLRDRIVSVNMRLLPWSIWQASAAVVVEDEMTTSTARKDRIVGRARTIPSSSSHEQRRRHLIHDSIALSLRDWKLSACCCFRIICLSAASFIVLSSFLLPLTVIFFLACASLDSVARSLPTLTW
jgi:hypothetical protein